MLVKLTVGMSAPTLYPTTFTDFSSSSAASKLHKWIDHIGEIQSSLFDTSVHKERKRERERDKVKFSLGKNNDSF